MEKVLVEIFVPAANRSFDVFIPQTSKMNEVVILVSKTLSNLSNGKYRSEADASAILCDAESGNILNINSSVYELKIKNGSKLMLI